MNNSKNIKTILVLASKSDVHADAVIHHSQNSGQKIIRIDTEELWVQKSSISWEVNTLSNGQFLRWGDKLIDANNVSAIYCRDFRFAKCETAEDVNTHLLFAEAKAALYGFFRALEDRYWMNPPWYDEMADNKPYQMLCASNIGLEIPKTLVTNDKKSFERFYHACDKDLIIKQLSEICLIDDTEIKKKGHIEGSDATAYGFFTEKIIVDHLKNLDQITNTPCLFQENLKKKADIRVTVVEEEVFCVLIESQENKKSVTDFRMVRDLPLKNYNLPEEISNRLVILIKNWNLKFAACDFVLTHNDKLVFIEANVEGNWLWIEKALDIPISRTIADILTNS